MKKRLISMLMAVLMIASLLPAAALAGDDTADTKCTHEKTSVVTVTKVDAKNKVPGIKATVCDACGEVQGVQIEKFSSTSWLTCRKGCETNKVVEVQKAACGQFGLTVSYCVKCGKEFAVSELSSNPETKAYYKAEAPLKHIYDAFTVEAAPTCANDGWGYVKCTRCGDPQFVANADKALEMLDYVNYENAAAYQKRYNEVKDMFAKTNPEHKDASKLVTVTREMTIVDDAGKTVSLSPATAYVHAKTISGKYDVAQGEVVAADKTTTVVKYAAEMANNTIKFVVAETFNEQPEMTADKYCPSCHKVFKGEQTGSAHVLGDTPKTLGYAPYVDKNGHEHYGMTDVWECKTCKTTIGGEYLSYKDYFNPNDNKNVANGTTMTIPGYAASCKDQTKGKTDTTIVYNANKGTSGEWEVKYAATDIPAPAHKMVDAVGVDPTCETDGYIYKNYKICTVCGQGEGDENDGVPDVVRIKALGHDYKAEALVPATCNSKGLSINKCTHCGKYEEKDGAYVTAPIDKVKEHVASDKLANVKEATCTEEGYTGDVVCKFCGKVMKPGEKTKMVDHTPMDVEAKAPTCTEPGVTKGTVCKVCGTVLSAQETVPALGHKTELVNAKEATCLEAGYTGDKVCTVCKQTIEKGTEVKALGHNYVKGVCTRCDAKQPGYNPFTDVKKGPYYDAILWAYCNGVTNGISDTVFGVDNGCTRAQIVTFLYRAAGEPKVENVKNPFIDVSKNSTYYNAIMWAVENGITTGKTATTFDPNAVCTRGQIVTFLWRYESSPIVSSLAKFDDVAAGSYCYNAVMWAVENGITNGKTATTFAPNDTCTRAQAVTFIYREFAK